MKVRTQEDEIYCAAHAARMAECLADGFIPEANAEAFALMAANAAVRRYQVERGWAAFAEVQRAALRRSDRRHMKI